MKILLVLLVLGIGENERVLVSAAKVRGAMASQAALPSKPPNVKLPNILKGVSLSMADVAPDEAVYAITLHATTNCGPCITMDAALSKFKKLKVTKVLDVIPNGVPTSGFPFVTFKHRSSGKLLYNIDERDPQKLYDIVKFNCDPISYSTVRSLTTDELKHFADSYKGQTVAVNGMTVQQHLMDSRHGFSRKQIAGLSHKEMLAVHSGHHYNLISPTTQVSEQVSEQISEQGMGARKSKSMGSLNVRSYVEQATTYIRDYIGEDKEMSFNLDRTGAQTFPLLKKGTDWSALAMFGRSGRVTLSTVSEMVPVNTMGFGYRVEGEDISIDVDAIVFKGLANRLKTSSSDGMGSGDIEMAEKPMGFDPATILTVLSVIRGVYMLLNPQADLQLGGNISATAILNGDTLTVNFDQGPSIRFVMFMQFQLAVKSVVITPTNIRLNYTGSRWFTYNDFAVE
jgi:hypothetical protein